MERANFELKTVIRTIEAMRPSVYPRLLQCIEQRNVEVDEPIMCSSRFRFVAGEWHRLVFMRSVAPLIRNGLMNDEYTAADIFLEILERRQIESERTGFDVGLAAIQQLMIDGHKQAQKNAAQRIAQQLLQQAEKKRHIPYRHYALRLHLQCLLESVSYSHLTLPTNREV